MQSRNLITSVSKGDINLKHICFIGDVDTNPHANALWLMIDLGNSFRIDLGDIRGWLAVDDLVILRNKRYDTDACFKVVNDKKGLTLEACPTPSLKDSDE